jgi:hypothetical protein
MLNDDISIYNPRFSEEKRGEGDREKEIGKREEKERFY